MEYDPSKMDVVVAGLTTKSDKIRALARQGYTRSQVADFLGIRYQHVRNVLVNDQRREGSARAMQRGLQEEERPFTNQPQFAQRVAVGSGGMVQLPQSILAAASLKEGDAVLVRLDEGEIRLYTPESIVRRIQAHMREFVPEGVNLVDELIAERRREAERDSRDE